MSRIDSIVVGAGVWGCTLARRLAEAGRQVLVLEARPAVGGNVRCETDAEPGIKVHKLPLQKQEPRNTRNTRKNRNHGTHETHEKTGTTEHTEHTE